jgi:DNA helicase-2/ATP-dependent DNA helicase PcrA
MTPPNEAVALSPIRRKFKAERKLSEAEKNKKRALEDAERTRMAEHEGQICFGLFAHFVSKLLNASNKVRRLVVNAFPFIILDEFQDTNVDQWHVVKALGIGSTLIALADPEQRIFEFAGAEAKRLQQFKDTFHPSIFDLKSDNHRSKGTDIVAFGNDLLGGALAKPPTPASGLQRSSQTPIKPSPPWLGTHFKRGNDGSRRARKTGVLRFSFRPRG